jgi:hypothetical protein
MEVTNLLTFAKIHYRQALDADGAVPEKVEGYSAQFRHGPP